MPNPMKPIVYCRHKSWAVVDCDVCATRPDPTTPVMLETSAQALKLHLDTIRVVTGHEACDASWLPQVVTMVTNLQHATIMVMQRAADLDAPQGTVAMALAQAMRHLSSSLTPGWMALGNGIDALEQASAQMDVWVRKVRAWAEQHVAAYNEGLDHG